MYTHIIHPVTCMFCCIRIAILSFKAFNAFGLLSVVSW